MLFRSLLQQQLPQLGRALIGSDPLDGSRWLRVMLRAHERQPAEAKRGIIDGVRRIVAEEYPGGPGQPAGEVTGIFVLLAQLVERMLADQWITFLLATAGMVGIIWFVQVVHYPLFTSVGRDAFVAYELRNTNLTSFVVGPFMAAEGATAL